MSYAVRIDADRSDRLDLQRIGTLRDPGRTPIDVLISNLSPTGCLIESDAELSIGTLISLGVPGVGVCHARVSRSEGSSYGCAFLSPIDMRDVESALTADSIIELRFPQVDLREAIIAGGESHATVADPVEGKVFSLKAKVMMILGSSAMLWGAIIVSVVAIRG